MTKTELKKEAAAMLNRLSESDFATLPTMLFISRVRADAMEMGVPIEILDVVLSRAEVQLSEYHDTNELDREVAKSAARLIASSYRAFNQFSTNPVLFMKQVKLNINW